MIVGYVRVSTQEQNEQRQIIALEEKQVEKIYIDKKSGKNTDQKPSVSCSTSSEPEI